MLLWFQKQSTQEKGFHILFISKWCCKTLYKLFLTKALLKSHQTLYYLNVWVLHNIKTLQAIDSFLRYIRWRLTLVDESGCFIPFGVLSTTSVAFVVFMTSFSLQWELVWNLPGSGNEICFSLSERGVQISSLHNTTEVLPTSPDRMFESFHYISARVVHLKIEAFAGEPDCR